MADSPIQQRLRRNAEWVDQQSNLSPRFSSDYREAAGVIDRLTARLEEGSADVLYGDYRAVCDQLHEAQGKVDLLTADYQAVSQSAQRLADSLIASGESRDLLAEALREIDARCLIQIGWDWAEDFHAIISAVLGRVAENEQGKDLGAE